MHRKKMKICNKKENPTKNECSGYEILKQLRYLIHTQKFLLQQSAEVLITVLFIAFVTV